MVLFAFIYLGRKIKNCHDCKENLDLYIDHELDGSLLLQFEEHANHCPQCSEMVTQAQNMRRTLRSIPVPMPEAEFFEQALTRIVAMTQKHEHRRWLATGFGSAVAAGLVGWMILGQPVEDSATVDQAPIAGLTVTIGTPKTIRFSIDSAVELTDANLVVMLPAGIEVVGFVLQREIEWTTTIKKGPNILELPIVVLSGTGGTIFARVEHENKTKSFEVTISVI